jgi:hypothetical protein
MLLLPLGLVAANGTAHRLKAHATAIFCLVGLSPGIAAATGIQLSVPLMLAFLWANTQAADEVASGLNRCSGLDAQAESLCYKPTA